MDCILVLRVRDLGCDTTILPVHKVHSTYRETTCRLSLVNDRHIIWARLIFLRESKEGVFESLAGLLSFKD
ncbi:hypothetical protein J6590_072431 [Homalodisca vitripennis]|nr:hypothetical protein J6590_072431 [Homalodisca vitripennis]